MKANQQLGFEQPFCQIETINTRYIASSMYKHYLMQDWRQGHDWCSSELLKGTLNIYKKKKKNHGNKLTFCGISKHYCENTKICYIWHVQGSTFVTTGCHWQSLVVIDNCRYTNGNVFGNKYYGLPMSWVALVASFWVANRYWWLQMTTDGYQWYHCRPTNPWTQIPAIRLY